MAKAPKFWVLMVMVAIVAGIFIFKGCGGDGKPGPVLNQTTAKK